jgi:hypothetical protein
MTPNEKTRALRKYEAAARVVSTEGGVDLFAPFGPMIAKATLPAALVDRLNAFADARVLPDQGSEFIVPQDVAFGGEGDSLAQHTARLITSYLARIENTQVEQVRFETFWIVSQYAMTPSPVHFHSGDISGVLYLKVPEILNEAAEEAKNYISGRQAGYLNFLSGGKQRFAKSLISFKPKVGDFYIFPGWLLHGAEPFRGRGERRSLAFNAFVTAGESAE